MFLLETRIISVGTLLWQSFPSAWFVAFTKLFVSQTSMQLACLLIPAVNLSGKTMQERNLCQQDNWLQNIQNQFLQLVQKWIMPLFKYRTSKFLQNITFYYKSSIKPSLLNKPPVSYKPSLFRARKLMSPPALPLLLFTDK